MLKDMHKGTKKIVFLKDESVINAFYIKNNLLVKHNAFNNEREARNWAKNLLKNCTISLDL